VKNSFGREEQLDQITSYFEDESCVTSYLGAPCAGGQGKSQVALEYCQPARKTYRGVFWTNSSSESTATQSLASVTQELDGSAVEALDKDDAKVKFALRTLEQWDDRWLIVFNNYNDPPLSIMAKTAKFNPSLGLQSSDHSDLLNIVDDLRSVGISHCIDLPLIIVCGDQSSGKSSVLEAVSGFPFPRKGEYTLVVLHHLFRYDYRVRIIPTITNCRPESRQVPFQGDPNFYRITHDTLWG
jgi:hypothetical protein